MLKLAPILLVLLVSSEAQAQWGGTGGTWGGMAYSEPDNVVGVVAGKLTMDEANWEAMRQCRIDGGTACKLLSDENRSGACAFLAVSPSGRWIYQAGSTYDVTLLMALRLCGRDCEIRAWFCG